MMTNKQRIMKKWFLLNFDYKYAYQEYLKARIYSPHYFADFKLFLDSNMPNYYEIYAAIKEAGYKREHTDYVWLSAIKTLSDTGKELENKGVL